MQNIQQLLKQINPYHQINIRVLCQHKLRKQMVVSVTTCSIGGIERRVVRFAYAILD